MDFNGVRKEVFRLLLEGKASELLKQVEKTGETPESVGICCSTPPLGVVATPHGGK